LEDIIRHSFTDCKLSECELCDVGAKPFTVDGSEEFLAGGWRVYFTTKQDTRVKLGSFVISRGEMVEFVFQETPTVNRFWGMEDAQLDDLPDFELAWLDDWEYQTANFVLQFLASHNGLDSLASLIYACDQAGWKPSESKFYHWLFHHLGIWVGAGKL
jgi:hypothetical protein